LKKYILNLILLFALNSYLNAQSAIRFAPLPVENYQIVMEQYKDLISFLKKHTKLDIDIVYASSYTDIIKKFKNKEIDLMMVGPLSYASLISQYQYILPLSQFLSKNGLDTYTCTLFSLADKNINLDKLQNTNIALTQKTSTCGYFFTESVLTQNNSSLLKNNYTYTGSHSDSVLSVLLGESEIGSAHSGVVNEYLHLGIKPIVISNKLPNFILVANTKTLSKNTINKLRKALAMLNPKAENNLLKITKKWHKGFRNGAVLIDDKKRKKIDEILKNAGIKIDR